MAQKTLVIADLRGGRNGIDSPVDPSVPGNQCAEAINVDFFEAPLGRKRAGARQLALTGGTAMVTRIHALFRHVPDGAEANAELFAVDGASPVALVKRLAGGVTWVDVTRPAEITSTLGPAEIDATTFNGKLFWSEWTTVNRLLVIEGSVMRWAGLLPPSGSPTVTNTGSGSYPAAARYYRTRFVHTGRPLLSEPNSSVPFTPSGTGLAARIARPTVTVEADSWVVEGSADNANFYQMAIIPVGTAFYDDTVAPSQYATLYALSKPIGTYKVLPAGKFLLSDDNRLLVGGTWHEQTDRIYFTPVLGSADLGDDERYVDTATQKNWVSLTSKNGGRLTGMGGPISNGLIYAFKYRQIWRLSPTGEVTAPYLVRKVSNTVGCIRHRTIVMAEDAGGAAALYFLSHKGPYRIGVDGLEYLGRDIEDQWYGKNGLSAVNLSAFQVGHGVYHSDLNQIWWWVATGSDQFPKVRLVLDIKQAGRKDQFGVRGGWTLHAGTEATSDTHCAVMFANTVGTAMSIDLKPYAGRTSAVKILKCDSAADQTDDGTAFQAYVKTRSVIGHEQFGQAVGVKENVLLARAATGVTLRQTIDRDFGAELQTSTVSLTPDASETRVLRAFEGSMQSDIGIVQLQIGDAAAASTPQWSLDQLAVTLDSQGDV